MFYIQTIKDLEKRVAALEAKFKPKSIQQDVKPNPKKAAKYTVGRIVDAVMVDGKPRNNKRIVRDAKKIGQSVHYHSVVTYLCGAVHNGKYERVGHGVYKAKRKA
mgnify:CR=1 FL=1